MRTDEPCRGDGKEGRHGCRYHNHNGEFDEKLNDRPQYDLMLEHLDPSQVKMQFRWRPLPRAIKRRIISVSFPPFHFGAPPGL